MTDTVKHRWDWCSLCEDTVVICGKCGNNCCNGGYGTINGQPCESCPSAYELYFTGKNKCQ